MVYISSLVIEYEGQSGWGLLRTLTSQNGRLEAVWLLVWLLIIEHVKQGK